MIPAPTDGRPPARSRRQMTHSRVKYAKKRWAIIMSCHKANMINQIRRLAKINGEPRPSYLEAGKMAEQIFRHQQGL
jgi:hypothetical protein